MLYMSLAIDFSFILFFAQRIFFLFSFIQVFLSDLTSIANMKNI